MAYKLPWGSTHPGLLVYLVDLSGSMKGYGKIERVSKAVWRVVDFLSAQCLDGFGYKNRFHLEVIGYNQYTCNLFSGDIDKINEYLDAHQDEQFIDINGNGKPQGLTHMAQAFDRATEIINEWIKKQNSKGIPVPAPIVINITDGYPEESGLKPEQARNKALQSAKALKNIAVPDGNVLLFNFHIDGRPGEERELLFPSTRPADARKAFLFDATSELNDEFVNAAKRAGLEDVVSGSRFMVSNISDEQKLVRLVAFGSSVSGLPKTRIETHIPE